jgi:hypothetical protein
MAQRRGTRFAGRDCTGQPDLSIGERAHSVTATGAHTGSSHTTRVSWLFANEGVLAVV